MAENEVTARRGMPQCVQLSEGLGVTSVPNDLVFRPFEFANQDP
jgi:hypothetical protein